MSLLESDLLDILIAVEEERLAIRRTSALQRRSQLRASIVASGGYPGSYKKGLPIDLNGADNTRPRVPQRHGA